MTVDKWDIQYVICGGAINTNGQCQNCGKVSQLTPSVCQARVPLPTTITDIRDISHSIDCLKIELEYSNEGISECPMFADGYESQVSDLQKGIAILERAVKTEAELKTLTAAVFDWCKDCELQSDCIAPDLKPCTLKPAYKIAITAKLKEG